MQSANDLTPIPKPLFSQSRANLFIVTVSVLQAKSGPSSRVPTIDIPTSYESEASRNGIFFVDQNFSFIAAKPITHVQRAKLAASCADG
jgi:hypothetical protein